MFCSQCGQSIGALSQCPHCGAATGVAGFAPAAGNSRVARHLQSLGILWTVYAVYSALRWMLILPILHRFLGGGAWLPSFNMGYMGPMGYGAWHPGGWIVSFLGALVLGRAVLSLAVGIVLLTRQPWGRIFAIVIAALTLIKPLLGTALAIYTLSVLLGRNAEQEYARLAAPGLPGQR